MNIVCLNGFSVWLSCKTPSEGFSYWIKYVRISVSKLLRNLLMLAKDLNWLVAIVVTLNKSAQSMFEGVDTKLLTTA